MRPAHSRTSKRDLVPVIEELTVQYGLGGRVVGKLLGYSQRYIDDLKREFKIPSQPRGDRAAAVIRRLLPDPIKSKCAAIYARSVVTAKEDTDQVTNTSAQLRAYLERAEAANEL
jgi:hypothetical protein